MTTIRRFDMPELSTHAGPGPDPWQADNDRIRQEIRRRITCVCGAGSPMHPDCACELPGWSPEDSFWTENVQPIEPQKGAE